MYALTAPWFGVNHFNIKVVNPEYCTKLETNVSSSNNNSGAVFLCFNGFNKLISIIDLSQVKNVLGISPFDFKVCQFKNLKEY